MRLTSIERLARLPEPAREPVVDECEFEHAFEGFEDGHLAAAAAGGGGGIGGDGGFVGGGGGGGLFSVRLGGCFSKGKGMREGEGDGGNGGGGEGTILTECVVCQCGLSDILKELGRLRNVDVCGCLEVAIFLVVCAKALRLFFNTDALVKP